MDQYHPRNFLIIIKNFGVGIEPTRTSQKTGGAPFAFPPLRCTNVVQQPTSINE